MTLNFAVENFHLTVGLMTVRSDSRVLKSEHVSQFFDYVGRVGGSVVGVNLLTKGVVTKDAEEIFDGIVGADLTMWE